ncbi:MAG TPA: hypothetical protein PLA45_02155, partial [Candidatus Dojkabacteria bacterium]|nr:hypothetical protein [Candidatus Dojkabacteria bacterium]
PLAKFHTFSFHRNPHYPISVNKPGNCGRFTENRVCPDFPAFSAKLNTDIIFPSGYGRHVCAKPCACLSPVESRPHPPCDCRGDKKIENNQTGQLAEMLKEKTGYPFKKRILKYDGRPFFVEDILEYLKNEK